MIKILKKQLFNPFTLPLFLIVASLVGFLILAALSGPRFQICLAFSLMITVIFLLSMRQQYTVRLAEFDLKRQDLIERMNILKVEIDDAHRAVQAFRYKIINFSELKGLTERLSLALTLEDTSKILSVEVNNLFGKDDITVILYLFQAKTGELGISSSQKGQMQINIKSKKGDIFDDWVIKTMKSLRIEDARIDFRFDLDKVEGEEIRPIRSLISVPMLIGNKALGILRVDSPKPRNFSTEDLRFLMTIADLGSIATENAQLYEKVEELAIRDSLTGLFLRRYLLDRLSAEMGRHLRRKKCLSFMMLDLDHFKKYNDQFGHVAGDIVLKTVGDILSETFGEAGTLVCRYGGEEFTILLPDCPKSKAVKLAEQVREKIRSTKITLRREKTHITVSIGVATFPEDAQIKEELIQKADNALYHAKNLGRNRVCSI